MSEAQTVHPKYQAIVTAGIQAGKKRNDVVGDIYGAMGTDADLSKAFTMYNDLSKASGLLLDKDGRAALLAKIVAQNIVDGTLNKDAAIYAYVERGRVSKATATSHIREYCTANGISFPLVARVKRDMDAVRAAVKGWVDTNVEKEGILAGLKQHFQYTDNTAADAYRRIGKELGILAPKNTENREAIARWFIDNGSGERKDVIAALSEKFGLTANTSAGYYSMYLFGVTYSDMLNSTE